METRAIKYELKGNPRAGLAYATLGFFLGFAAVALFGPSATKFKATMDLSATMLGLLVAIPTLTGSLLRIPFGAWVDRVGGKKPMLVLLGTSLVGMLGLATTLLLYYPSGITPSMFPLMLFLGVLVGFGIATFSVGIPQTSYWFPKQKQGRALGLFAGLGNTAPGWFTFLVPIALVDLGLPMTYLAWFIFVLVGTTAYALLARDAYFFQLRKQEIKQEEAVEVAKRFGQDMIPSGQVSKSLIISARNWKTWALVSLYFTSFGGFLALTSWLPTYWGLYHGITLTLAGAITAIGFTLLASFLRVYGGFLSDRLGGENIAIIGYATILVGALALIANQGFLLDLVGELLIGAGMGIANAAVFKLVSKYVPEAVGGASGWVGGLGAFGGFVVPPILGAFVDSYGSIGYSIGFIVYLLLALMCLVVSYILKRSH